MEIIQVDPQLLKPAEYNPRQMTKKQADDLTKSIKEFGLVDPIIVNNHKDRQNIVIGGHQRLKIATVLGFETVPVVYLDLTEKRERELNLRLNRNNGEWDWDLLATFEKQELLEVGFEQEEIERWLGKNVEEDEFDIDKVFSESAEPITQAGDIWKLGEHTLMCGDATKDIKSLVGDEMIDLLITDPPYGVDYTGGGVGESKTIREKIENDAIADYREWFAAWLKEIPWSMYNSAYIFMSGTELHNLRLAIEDVGMYWSAYLVWIKNNAVFGRQDYAHKHEWIAVAYAWKDRHKNYALDYKTTVLEYKRPSKSELHPTMKPIKLLADLIQNSSIEGHTVLDLFGGSGSTMIACEQLGRKCYMMEISPKYCDVIIKRWETLTNKKAERITV